MTVAGTDAVPLPYEEAVRRAAESLPPIDQRVRDELTVLLRGARPAGAPADLKDWPDRRAS